jgi:hypothetical protein
MGRADAGLTDQITDFAEMLGWVVYHFADSRRDIGGGRYVGDRQAAGWPDLAIVGFGRLLLWELKAERGRLTKANGRLLPGHSQVETLEALGLVAGGAGGVVDVRVVRPSDWDRVVVPILRAKGRPVEV